ncbi:CubicO group peptidase, beta-lactamase class C family [Enhydrobacter aerosaccus]|uniref:CubicO group peptidase, beta-lactamase class C family n=1 Tax=Enhydrobacter aerosaccus TaxID=225324 RepID=A0A1T4SS02_9HYPH|nr:serine hydrolase [Enhydrobacter aerosaccus]SKA31015.1 CubicO group peptidase, beta-lactamase class C family [Enhydrobacter aerosaccus]
MRRRRLVPLLGGAALAPLVASPARAEPPGGCAVPSARDDGWPVAAATEDKLVDRAALCRMTDGLATSPTANVHAVLVARGGRLVFERYLSGPDEIHDRHIRNVVFDADTQHDLKSVSKSVASLVVGIAIDRGLIDSVNQPVFSFFPELSDLRTPEKDSLKLSHVLTMSMGLAWIEATPSTGNDDNDEARMHRAADPCRYVLGLPMTAPPGQEFFYNTGALALLSAIVRKATGQPLDELARTALFEPLGITGVEWKRIKGDTDAGGGLRLRPRDMAKIGQLVLAGGRWNGRQLVPKDWIDASITPWMKATSGFSYGYLWWLGTTRIERRDVPWIAALGRGGQSIRIVPSLDLVVAVTAGYYQDYSPQAFQLQFGIFRDVLKATPPAG